MPDNKQIKQPLDSKLINIHEPYEVNYWCKKWGCTEQQLKTAISAVGTSAEAVAKHLGKYLISEYSNLGRVAPAFFSFFGTSSRNHFSVEKYRL